MKICQLMYCSLFFFIFYHKGRKKKRKGNNIVVQKMTEYDLHNSCLLISLITHKKDQNLNSNEVNISNSSYSNK